MADSPPRDTVPDNLTQEEIRERAVIDGKRYRTISVGNNATEKRPGPILSTYLSRFDWWGASED